MDLRELVRTHPELVVGHRPITDRLNLRKESRRFSVDPLAVFLATIADANAEMYHGDVGRYAQAFSWYALCLARALKQCSTSRTFYRELRYQKVTAKYSPRQVQIARSRKTVRPYQELDYQNLIIHACILLDRTITLSRRFLRGGSLPSFTSFSDHKKFLTNRSSLLAPDFREYVHLVSQSTDWFEIPLKVLRDKYLIHSSEQHMAFFGWSTDKQWDLEMNTIISGSRNQSMFFERVKCICFSPRRLARDIETFLSEFARLGCVALRVSQPTALDTSP